jgi:hypothetical protein
LTTTRHFRGWPLCRWKATKSFAPAPSSAHGIFTKSKLVEIKPEMIVRHPGTKFSYNLSTNTYGSTKDLLLIEVQIKANIFLFFYFQLPEALHFTDPNVKPICLSAKQPSQNRMALAAGWGLTSPICDAKLLSMGTPDQLHIGRVEVLSSTAECRNHQFDVNLTEGELSICTFFSNCQCPHFYRNIRR